MERKVYPVSQVNRYVKAVLMQDKLLSGIWIRGEISNYKHHSSGHRYFTLKDSEGQISAVMFSTYASSLTFRPVDGMQVVVYGEITLYERSGQYQINVRAMEEDGAGALYQAFLRQKERFEKAGWFDPAHKKEIPSFAHTIGIVTSPTGAAVRDMIQTARRRFPGIQILFCPCLVQGPGASASIASAIRKLDEDGRAQVLLVGRGGGSIEDLWAFNEEETVRAIYQCQTPVISAVGHETDFTLADFAADLRAATPTAASELAVPDAAKLLSSIRDQQQGMAALVHDRLQRYRKEASYYMDQTAERMLRLRIDSLRQQIDMETRTIGTALHTRLDREKDRLQHIRSELDLLDPYLPLEKGYSLLYDGDEIVRSAGSLTPGQMIKAVLKGGEGLLEVKERTLHS